jgi:hypothetical protein
MQDVRIINDYAFIVNYLLFRILNKRQMPIEPSRRRMEKFFKATL